MSILEDDSVLERLALMLSAPGLPVQTVVAREAAVPQALVSLALNGRLRRVTPRVERLFEYAASRMAPPPAGADTAVSADAPDASSRALRPPAASSGTAAAEGEGSRLLLSRAARATLQRYMDDGFDPAVLIDQIEVLRRAQRVR